jgi:hypothetical protein
MKKIIIGYCIVSSIILHIVVVGVAIWIAPTMMGAIKAGKQWAHINKNTESGIIKDISTIIEGDNKYNGYAIEHKGKLLYVMGSPEDKYSIGDNVKIAINKHPYEKINSLMVVILP